MQLTLSINSYITSMACNKDDLETMCVSSEEREVICDIRNLDFGRVSVFIQNGVMINKEITKTIKNNRHSHRENFVTDKY